jgi:hypothetical protein
LSFGQEATTTTTEVIATHLDQSNYLANQQQVLGFVVQVVQVSHNCVFCIQFSLSDFTCMQQPKRSSLLVKPKNLHMISDS